MDTLTMAPRLEAPPPARRSASRSVLPGSWTRAASGLLATLTILAGCGGSADAPSAEEEDAVWSLETARIVFQRRTPEGSAIYVLDRGTGEERRLTPADSRNWSARPSRAGDRLAFVSLRDGNYEVYVMGLDGGNVQNLTRDPDYDILGAWSPDGRALGFMSTRGFELGGQDGPFPGHLYVTDLGDSSLRQVTETPLTSSLGPSDWSPDGRTMLLARDGGDQIDVYALDVETGLERRLTDDPASEFGATFSSQGDRVAFHAEADGASRIVVMDLEGGARRVLTPGPGVHYFPRWSPDDRWLLVTRRAEGDGQEQYDVVAVSVADGTVRVLLDTPVDERGDGWLP